MLIASYPNGSYLVYWFAAADVNYSDENYSFTSSGYHSCEYSPYPPYKVCSWQNRAETDFPIVPLGSNYFRAYQNEDDWGVDYFSTRSGDWSGDVRTFNFGTAQHQTLFTRVDGNNHMLVSSDQVFGQSGLRRINAGNAYTLTNGGISSVTASSNGFVYEFVVESLQTAP